MCFPWFQFRKVGVSRNFHGLYPCSCDLCGKNFNTMEELIIHMGCHQTDDINHRLLRGYGTVRCNKCQKSFKTVMNMYDHPCNTRIQGLSPVSSSGSLESVLIHE